MNKLVNKILSEQRYDGYKLHFNYLDYNITNPEYVLFNYDIEKLHFYFHKDASIVIKKRFEMIIPYIISYFNHRTPDKKINFIFNLGDFDKTETHKDIPVICFTKKKYLDHILVPNIDFFGGMINTHINSVNQYDIDFALKINGSCFAGSSTGYMPCNKRVRYCLSMADKSNHYAKITDITQGSLSEWQEYFPNITDVVKNTYFETQNQLKYKILVNIDGNTLCYSRLYWQILSNSAVVYIEPDSSSTQFFDTKELEDCYYTSSIDHVNDLYEYILNPQHTEKIKQTKIKHQTYLQDCFSEYFEDNIKFLSNIITYIFDELLRSNNDN